MGLFATLSVMKLRINCPLNSMEYPNAGKKLELLFQPSLIFGVKQVEHERACSSKSAANTLAYLSKRKKVL